MTISLVFGLLLLAIPFWAMISLHRHAMVRKRDLASATGCPRCSYPTAGLDTLRCPECGADFLKEGILTPPLMLRHRRSKSVALLSACALTVAVGSFVGMILGAMLTAAMQTPIAMFVVGPACVVGSLILAIPVTLRAMTKAEQYAERLDPTGRPATSETSDA